MRAVLTLITAAIHAGLALQPAGQSAHHRPGSAAARTRVRMAYELTDRRVTLAPYFKVNDLAKFKEVWQADYANFLHKEDCVHYAFCFSEDGRAHCREAYKDAEAVLQHLEDVDVPLNSVLDSGVAELERLEIHGPKEAIEKLREPLTPFGTVFYETLWGFCPSRPAVDPDTVCHLYPYFTLKQPDEFKSIWQEAYPATKAAADEEASHQYAFSFDEDKVASCRESYADAAGMLKHLENVDAPLKQALDGPAEILRLEVHAPPSEIEKLKPALDPLGCQFFAVEWGFRNAV